LALEAQVASGPAVRAPRLFDAPMVGRDRDLDLAHSHLRRTADGRGGALIVTGAAGMGKSRFADALLEQAERSGFHTLRGGAHAEEGKSPYAPFAEAVDPLLRDRPDLTSTLTPGALSALALLVPSASRSDAGEAHPVDRHRILSAVGQLLERVARERPMLIVLDDLHAADEATLGLVHYLARSARRTRLMLVLGAREEGMSGAPARLRTSLIEQHAGVEVVLEPLDRDAVRAVVQRVAGRPLPQAAVRAIEQASAGNPFFVEELATGVDAEGQVTVPRRLHHVLEGRMEQLEAVAGDLTAPLAVLEDGFRADELARLARRDEPEVVRVLDAACEAGALDRSLDRGCTELGRRKW